MKTDREKQEFKGQVKTVRVESSQNIVQENGETTEELSFSQTTTFNRDGWIIEVVSQNPDGSKWRVVSDYSDSGKPIAMRSYNSSDEIINELKYVYDDKERLAAEQDITRDGKTTTPVTYIYDSEGKKLKIQEFPFIEDAGMLIGIEGANSVIGYAGRIGRSETRYNDRGEEIELRIFNGDGVLVSRMEVTRDAQGNIVEETQYLGDIVEFSPFAPDSEAAKEPAALTEEEKAAERISALMFAPGAVMSRRIHQYNESGMLVETKQIMMGMETESQTFTYDEDGNKSEEVHYFGNGFESKTIFTRDFDANGNWTKEAATTESRSNEKTEVTNAVRVTYRTLTYY